MSEEKPSEDSEFARFQDGLIDGWVIPLLAHGKQEELAKEFGVTTRTIRNWKKRVDWTAVRRAQERNKDHDGLQVDHSLLKKAVAGDVRAIELWKQANDGFVPMQGRLSVDGTDSELLARAAQIRERLNAARAGGAQPGTGPHQPDAGKAGTA